MQIDGVFNLRELGSLRARDGRQIRSKYVYRSGALHDLDLAHGLGVRTVLDLRVPGDVERDADRLGPLTQHPEVRRLPIPLVPPEHEGEAGSEYLNRRYGRRISADRYKGYLEIGGAGIRAAFEQLTQPGAFPLLVHCTAGKDRTGVFVALLLDVLGVPRDLILADYARSNDAIPELLRHLGADARAETLSEADLALLGAPVEAMDGFLDYLYEMHAGARPYLESLGLERALFEALEEALLSPAASTVASRSRSA